MSNTLVLGSSLWLIPPAGSAIDATLSKLIHKTIPPHFAPDETVPSFIPHVTLTSRLPKEFANPQSVLNDLEIEDIPEVVFKELNVGDTFFTRITLHAEKTPALVGLARQCRHKFAEGNVNEADATLWATVVFTPHLSLVYSSMPAEKVKAEVLHKVTEDVDDAGVVAGPAAVHSAMGGWKGGRVVLVQTWKDLDQWKVIAERVL